MFHAVVHLDHHQAQVLQFNAQEVHSDRIEAHRHVSRQHGGQDRAEQAFFAELCLALQSVQEVLVTGSHQVLATLRHYIEAHQPQLQPRIAGYQTVDHPSPGQLLALAREFFVKHDRMAGVPTPT